MTHIWKNKYHVRKESGISLVECLISIVIISIGIIAIALCLNAALANSYSSNRFALGTAIAEKTIDEIRRISVPGYIANMTSDAAINTAITVTAVTIGTTTTTIVNDLQKNTDTTMVRSDEKTLISGKTTVTMVPYFDATISGWKSTDPIKTYQVTVAVSWKGKNNIQQVSLVTIVGNHTAQ